VDRHAAERAQLNPVRKRFAIAFWVMTLCGNESTAAATLPWLSDCTLFETEPV
jgi:hypothetical protein